MMAMKLALFVLGGGIGAILVLFGSAAYGLHQYEIETRGKRPTLW